MIKFRPNLYIGNYKDAADPVQLQKDGITGILNVAFEIDEGPVPPTEFRYFKIGLMDNDKNKEYTKRLAVDALKRMLTEKEQCLVHCAAGLSRSVYVAVSAIAELESKDPHDVYEELKLVHPMAMWGSLFTSTYIPMSAAQSLRLIGAKP